MKYAPIITLALAAAFVAGCGGGSSITQEEHDALQQQFEAEQEAKRKAEAAAEAARQESGHGRSSRLNKRGQAEQQRQQELAGASSPS